MKTQIKKTKKVYQKANWKYFDDCPICQAMKNADQKGKSLSEQELLSAFRLASTKKTKKNEK